MKRSEVLRAIALNGVVVEGYARVSTVSPELAEKIVDSLNIDWQAEEEPLPEELVFRSGTSTSNPAAQHGNKRLLVAYHHREGERVLAEAVRRYNAWPALRGLAGDLATCDVCDDYGKRLLAILDGEEG